MPEHGALGDVEMIRLVERREIRERMRAKSFLVGTVLLVIVIVAIGIISRLATDDGPGTTDIGVVAGQADTIVTALENNAATVDRQVSVVFFDDIDAARAAIDDGDIDVAVDPEQYQAVFDEDVDNEMLALLQQTWAQLTVETQLADAGLTATEISELLSVTPLEPVTLDGDDSPSGLGVLTGTLAAVLLFVSLQTFGTYVLTGVVEEKSSAVVELLLVRARADQLLAGKVIGIGLVALTQFAAAVAAGLASLAIADIDVPAEIWSSVPMMLVWFLGGFAMYATLFALAGSLVSRQEDAQAAAAPINYALVGAYLLVFIFGYVPDSTASTILSLLPPIAPFLMPMRMAAGAASTVEIAIAVAGLLVATLAAWKLAGRIYEQVLLRRGSRIGWREALSLARHS